MKRIIRWNHRLVTGKPWIIIVIALIMFVVALGLATSLNLEMSWVSLAPKGHESVQEYQQILEDFPTLDTVIVMVEAKDYENLEIISSDIEANMKGLKDYVSAVTAGVDQDFTLDYGLNYMSDEDLDMLKFILSDPGLESFYTMNNMFFSQVENQLEKGDLSDDEIKLINSQLRVTDNLTVSLTDGLKDGLDQDLLEGYMTDFFTGDSLMTTKKKDDPDTLMTTIMVQPNFDMLDIDKLEPGVAAMEQVVFDARDKYPEATIGITGMHVVGRDETASIASDSQLTTLIAIVLILLLLYMAFRVISAPIFTFIPLVFGVVWSVGIVRIFIGRLNMITAFSAAMIIGLGIDYSIHLYSAYTEERSLGIDKKEALLHSMLNTGPSVIVGAMTTSCAFLALNVSSLDMLGELGTVMAIGILTTLVAVFWILPSMIILKKEKAKSISKIKGNYPFIGKTAILVHRFRLPLAIVLLLLAIFMGYKGNDIEFDMNIMNLEPEGLDSIALMDYMVDEYDISTDSFSLEADSIDQVKRLEKDLMKVDGVHDVVSIMDVMPKASDLNKFNDLQKNLQEISDYSLPYNEPSQAILVSTVQELKRSYEQAEKYEGLELPDDYQAKFDSLITALQKAPAEDLNQVASSFYDTNKALAKRIISASYLTLNNLPDAYKNQFVSQDGQHYLVNVYPDFDIWSNIKSQEGKTFINDISKIAPSITGTPLFMKIMYETASSEAKLTGLLIIGVLFLILLIHFKSLKYALLAFIPLIFTLIFSVGSMVLVGMDFNMINFLGLLLIIGIGVDDGVHILHHYQNGKQSIEQVFSSVGRAILLTTLTTMFGFGSLMFSSYRGIATLGSVLLIGVGYAFLMTVLIIPMFLKDRQVD